MKRLATTSIAFLTCLMLLAFTSLAQDGQPKQISGGVLNGKAQSLPKPVFPPAAAAVGASGAVTVQVLIDENGEVVSATGISGHPLLRAAAVEAAKGAKFAPTLLSGQPVKVSGVLVYNFVGALQLARISFILKHAELTSSFGAYGAAESIASQFPMDWTDEKLALNSLTYETPKVEPKVEAKKAIDPPQAKIDGNRYTVIGDSRFSTAGVGRYGSQPLDSRSVASVKTVYGLIETRASVRPSATWAYEFGKEVAALVAEIDDRSKFQSNLASIESLAGRAPAEVAKYSLQQVNEFIDYAKKEGIRDDARQEVISRAVSLTNLRY